MHWVRILSSLAFLLTPVVQSKIVELDWDITYTTANPDGLLERQVIGVNGKWPIPYIEADKGDIIRINAHNSLDWVTNLHGHGLHYNGTGDQDGAMMITECGIAPGDSRTYEYHTEQSGTFWIHSHIQGQYMDGLRTAMILHDPEDPYQGRYDDEFTVTISDWYHNDSRVNTEWFLSKENLDAVEPVPQSAVIGDQLKPKYYFEPGKTYRLRLINMSGFVTFYFSIDGHDFDIIEVDGEYTQQYNTKSVYLTPAQRMSILVKAKHSKKLNYNMHFDMDTEHFDYLPKDLQLGYTAPIYYDEMKDKFAPSEDIGTKSTFDDFNLRSLENSYAVEPDRQFNFTVEQQVTTDGLNRGMVNRVPFIAPLTPVLFSELTTGELANDPRVYGPQSNAYVTENLEMVEVVINNYDDDAHPFHLHGHTFQVIARNTEKKQRYDGINKVGKWNLDSPVRRDTVRVDGDGFVVLRYRSDNPGAWFFHCHIEWHAISGMAVVMVENPDQTQQTMPVDSTLAEQCVQQGYFASGNGAGKEGLDLSGAPSGIYLPKDKPITDED
ncbi:multicopper oxidase-domain-containing protein [Phascolomyces articulosus]|uniref:Multicopper oxidase-domain-containing protein n=1 Tax=Phascolomyces articulosus TaxID=60185 RepID=A0AAD5K6A2_9FUNG|nr:multicopper oxidase-domain-containing protein [Phascolomyces articulosus]